jgi:hypothetical protein
VEYRESETLRRSETLEVTREFIRNLSYISGPHKRHHTFQIRSVD